MNRSESKLKLSPVIAEKLSEVRSLMRRYVTVHSLCLVLFWLLIVFWLGGLIDYLPVRAGASETPRGVRMAMLVAMGIGALWILGSAWLPRLFAKVRDRSLALLIERKFPQFENRLITAVELCGDNAPDVSDVEAHAIMLSQVHARAAQQIQGVEVRQLFNWRPIWLLVMACILGLLVTLGFAISQPDWMSTWTSRLFGLSDETWPRKASLRADGVQLEAPTFTGQLVADRLLMPIEGDTFRVPDGAAAVLLVSADTTAPEVPEVCTLFYRSASGDRGRANLRRVGQPENERQTFMIDGPPLDGITENLSLDVVGLDARLRDLKLEVVEPPVVSEMTIEAQYPSYLAQTYQQKVLTETLAYRIGVQIPEGSALSLVGTANQALSTVQYVVYGGSGPADREGELVIKNVVPNGTRFALPLGVLTEDLVVEVRLFDQHGLPAAQVPRYAISMQTDMTPQVQTTLDGIGTAITANAILPIRGEVTDDHGLASTQAELRIGDDAAEHITLNPQVDGTLIADIDLQKLEELQQMTPTAGDVLSLLVKASDYYDINQVQHVGLGQALQLAVVTTDELLVILDRQELEQRQRLELIVSELEQMRGLLSNLQASIDDSPQPNADEPKEPTSNLTHELDEQSEGAARRAAEAIRRRSVLGQQCVLQADKSRQELSSLAARVDNLRKQLVNNRIDSYDRQQRLLQKVHLPLVELLDNEFRQMQADLSATHKALAGGTGREQTMIAIDSTDSVLLRLAEITENMLDMESFNEIVDLVRGLLEDQEELLEATEKQQRQRILDLLK